jgi:outer membrane immunogenic protein
MLVTVAREQQHFAADEYILIVALEVFSPDTKGDAMRKLTFTAAALAALGAGPALAADMPVKAPVYKAPPPPAIYSWSGFYIGANIGGAWSRNNSDGFDGLVFPPFAALPPEVAVITIFPGQFSTLAGTGNRSGAIGGGQIGYNWQVQQFVLGVEADGEGTGLHGLGASATRTFAGGFVLGAPLTQTVSVNSGNIDWMASFRGRVGVAADRALFYLTGGAAVAGIGGSTTTVNNGPGIAIPAGSFSATNAGTTTRWGATVGGGVEWAFANNWSVAGEYRHSDFGNRGIAFTIPDGFGGVFATGTLNARLTVDQATARLNYRFSGPVATRD